MLPSEYIRKSFVFLFSLMSNLKWNKIKFCQLEIKTGQHTHTHIWRQYPKWSALHKMKKKNEVFRWKKSELNGNYFECCSFTMVSKWRNGQYTGNETKMERENLCEHTHGFRLFAYRFIVQTMNGSPTVVVVVHSFCLIWVGEPQRFSLQNWFWNICVCVCIFFHRRSFGVNLLVLGFDKSMCMHFLFSKHWPAVSQNKRQCIVQCTSVELNPI